MIPTLKELYTQILTDLEAELTINIPLFGKSILRAIAAVQAAKLKIFYLSIAKVQKNVFVDTAEPEANGGTLERFGRVKLGREPFAATSGIYDVTVTGEIGGVIQAGQTFKSNDDASSPGKLYVTDEIYTLTAESQTIQVRALETGLDSRLVSGDEMTATNPIAQVDSLAVVTNEHTEPKAEEDLELYRERVIDGFRLEPQGGAGTDYRLWSYDAQGVLQSYPYAKSGAANEINLYVEATIEDSTDSKGTPSAQLLLDVESVIEFDPDTSIPVNERGRRPLGVFQIHYLPVTVKDTVITITGLEEDTTTIRNVIESALRSEVETIRPYVPSADIEDDRNDKLTVNKIISVISTAIGDNNSFESVQITVDSVPISTSLQFYNGDIPYLESVAYN